MFQPGQMDRPCVAHLIGGPRDGNQVPMPTVYPWLHLPTDTDGHRSEYAVYGRLPRPVCWWRGEPGHYSYVYMGDVSTGRLAVWSAL